MTKTELSHKLYGLAVKDSLDNHEDGSSWQQTHARLVDKYLTSYPNSTLTDDETAALIFALNSDVQVRDYALGLNQAIDTHYKAWHTLMKAAPKAYQSAQACLASQVSYEQGMTAIAVAVLSNAKDSYPLAQLLARVYAAGWEPKSFADMRQELHPKVVAGIFGEDN